MPLFVLSTYLLLNVIKGTVMEDIVLRLIRCIKREHQHGSIILVRSRLYSVDCSP